MWLDTRIPVRFGALRTRAADEAVVTDGAMGGVAAPSVVFEAAAGHVAGCACCNGRSAAALALAKLFRERAVAPGTPFRGVLAAVGPAGEAALRDALAESLLSGRYRVVES